MRSAVALIVFTLVGCTPDSGRQLIKTAADLQHDAADAYAAAKIEETAAVRTCKAKLAPAVLTAATIEERCAMADVPLPYSPAALTSFAGPLNGLFEAVHAADAAVRAKAGEAAALFDLASHVSALLRDLGVLGPKAPKATGERAAAAAAKVGKP